MENKYKKYILFFLTLFLVFYLNKAGSAQTIVAAEYFFNTDPGVGNATPFTIPTGNDITTSLNISTSGLSPGFNHLFIRVKNDLGIWSLYEGRTIFIKPTPNPVGQLITGEYFFNTDPGVGNATPVSFTAGNDITTSFVANTTGLSPGFNFLFFRVRDQFGTWSLYEGMLVFVKLLPPNHNLVSGEYFFNTDPGFGNGTQFSFPQSADTTLTFIIPTTGVPPGENYIYFRFMDSDGKYTIYARQMIRICDVAALADFSADTVCLGGTDSTSFVNLSTGGDTATVYKWDFNGDGIIDRTQQGIIGSGAPLQFYYQYQTGGTFQCMLITDNGGGCSDTIVKPVVVIAYPAPPIPNGPASLCINSPNSTYTIPQMPGATSYTWTLSPTNAGVLTANDTVVVIDWNNTFTGTVQLSVKADYGPCTSLQSAPYSPVLNILISTQTVGGTVTLSQSSICQGSTTGNITLSGHNGAIIKWQKRNPNVNNGNWIDISNSSNPLSENPTIPGTWDYRAVVKNNACDTAYSGYATINVNAIPSAAGTIVGPTTTCQGQYQVNYTVPAISGASNYTWTVPTGATIMSGNGTNSILVNFYLGANSGVVTVLGSNSCGVGAASQLGVNVNVAPVANAGTDSLVVFGASTTLTGSAYGGEPPYTYDWSPHPLCSIPNAQTTATVGMLNSTVFTLTVTDSLGCQSTDQVSITVYGQPLTATPIADPLIVCQGQSSQLFVLPSGGSGTYTYLWSSNPPGQVSTPTLQNPVVSPTTTTQFTVVVNDGSQNYSASTTVTISPKPVAAGVITGPSTVCQCKNGVVFTVPPIANATGYSWTLPTGATIASGSNTNTISVNFDCNALSGTISVFGTNICGNGTASNFSVTVNQVPAADAGLSQNISIGQQTTLNGTASGGSGSFSYTWSPTQLLVPPVNIPNPQTIHLNNSATFTLTVTDNVTTCTSTSSVLILVTGLPLSATTSAVPGTICQGETSQLNVLPAGGSGTYSYEWSSNPVGLQTTTQNPVVSPSITTTYTVTVTAGSQTTQSSVVVTVSPTPSQPGTIIGPNVVCRGANSVEYSVPADSGVISYHWSLPPGATLYSGNGTNTILVNYALNAFSGNINVYASNFCGNSPVSTNHFVTVNALPNANAGTDVVINPGEIATLQGSASGGSGTSYTFCWSPAILLDTPCIATPTTIIMNQSTTFTLTVTDNATGCDRTATVNVIVQGGPLSATANPPFTICEGASAQLNVLVSGGNPINGYSYTWTSTPPGSYPSIPNPTVNPSVTTTYTVEITDNNTTVTDATVIFISPLPDNPGTITGDIQVCQEESGVSYNIIQIPNASGYLWTLPSGAILASGANTNFITVNYTSSALSGDITVAGTNFCGVGNTSAPLSIQVDSLPFVDAGQDIPVSQNTSVQLNGTAWGGSGSFNYSWTPTTSLLPPFNITNPTTSVLSTSAVFTLLVTDNITGCQNSDQVQVIVTGVPLSVSASATPSVVCQAAQSNLYALPTGGSGSYSYSWSSNPVGFQSNLQNPPVSPTITTTYTVTINDGGATNTSAVVVTVTSLPAQAGQISGPASACKGSSGIIYSVPVIQGATSYTWTLPTGATIGSGANTNTISVNFTNLASSGAITVVGVNSCGSGPSSSYQITLNQPPVANAGQDQFIQTGTTTTLSGSATGGFGTFTYLWSPHILLTDPATTQNPNTVPISNPTTYSLTVTDTTSGCIGTDNVMIYITNPGVLNVAVMPSPQNICQGQSTTLNTIPYGGIGNYTFNWSSTPAPSLSSTLQNPIVNPTVTTTYYVTCTSGTETATVSAVVTVNPLPSTPGSIIGSNIVCQGASNITYTVTPVNGATSYNWTLPFGANIIAGAGSNSITVSFAANAQSGNVIVNGVNICGTGPDSPPLQLTVNPSPLVDAGPDQSVGVINNGATLSGNFTSQSPGPFSHVWTPTMLFSQTSHAYLLNTTTSPLSSSATFTLTVTDSITGCSAFDQVNVYFTGGSVLSATASASLNNICQGQSTQLNALPSGGSGNYQYLWTAPPDTFTSTLQNPIVTPSVTTQYLLKVYDGIDSAMYSIIIYVNPQPAAAGTITGPTSVCQGATAVMFTVPPIANASTYEWNLPTGFTIISGSGMNTIYVSIDNSAGSGALSVYGANSCGIGTPSSYFNVNVNLSPFAYTSADQYIPYNSSTQIFGHAVGGSGQYNYVWEPAASLQVNNVQDPYTINLTQSTVYTLTVTDNVTLCPSVDNVQIIVYGGPGLSVVANSNSTNICGGQSVQLNALPTGGNGLYSYTWSPTTGLSNPNIYNPVATPNATTEYTVQVVSAGLTATNSILITVSPQPGNAGNITGPSSVCKGETGVIFSVPPIANATNYYWTLPYGATIVSGGNSNSIMVNFSSNAVSGNVSVFAGNICGFGNTSPNYTLTVNPTPVVYAGPDQQIPTGTNTSLSGLVYGGSGNYSYQWTPTTPFLLPNNDTLLNPVTGILNVSKIFTLTVVDLLSGCVSSDYVKIIVCGGPLSVDAFADNDTICEGQSVLLDAIPSGGNCVSGTYTWTTNPPSGFTSNMANVIATPSVTTTYVMTYSDGSNTATDAVVITVNPLVGNAGNIQGPAYVCQNSGVITYAIPPIVGAVNYFWTFPSGTIFVSNPDSNVVDVIYTDTAESGFVSVYATSSCGVGMPSPTFFVVVKPLPGNAGQIVGPSYMTKNNTAQYSIPAIPGVFSYYWVLPYGVTIVSGHGTNVITVEFTDDAKSGFIYVYGINSCGNGDASNEHLVTIITSLAELYNMELKLYPNPNSGEFLLEVYGDTDINFELLIVDLFGRNIKNSFINQNKTKLDYNDLPNGMYYLILKNEKVKLIERFVIVK